MTRWIHGISRELLRAAFRDYFGVADEHADILVVLYGRAGEWTHLRRLQVLLNSHRPPKRQAIYERVRVLREAMEAESLLSGGQLDELGYALSEVGYAECAKALRALAQVLVRNGPVIEIAPSNEDAISPISDDPAVLIEAIRALEAERPSAPAVPERGDGRARPPLRTAAKA